MFVALLLPLLPACSVGGNTDSDRPSGGAPNTPQFSITVRTADGGTLSPAMQQVNAGGTARFTVSPDRDFYADRIEGCEGRLEGNVYTTGAIDGDCEITAAFANFEPSKTPTLSFVPTKRLRFNWVDTVGATHYRLLENADGNSGFTQAGEDIKPGVGIYDHRVPLYARVNAQYILQSCVFDQCYDSGTAFVSGTLVESIGYFKASNPDGATKLDGGDQFGSSVSLSRTGDTLAVGAYGEDSSTTGVNQVPDNDTQNAGAVYVYTRDGNRWEQQAYIKPSHTESGNSFGLALSLDGTGDTLAVGAAEEPDSAVYVFTRNGDNWAEQERISSNGIPVVSLSGRGDTLAVGGAGKVTVFTRNNDSWTQQQQAVSVSPSSSFFGNSLSLDGPGDTLAVGDFFEDKVYVFVRDDNDNSWKRAEGTPLRGDNTDDGDVFGGSLSLNDQGDTLAISATYEDSGIAGVINGPVSGQGNHPNLENFGAVYVFIRSNGVWSQQAYIKASNPGGGEKDSDFPGQAEGDFFGHSVSLSSTGDTLAVSSRFEASDATGINGSDNDLAFKAGAVYVYVRDGTNWRRQAYVKASNTRPTVRSEFGMSVSLDGAGETLAVGAPLESSGATGINGGDQDDVSAPRSGAVYLY